MEKFSSSLKTESVQLPLPRKFSLGSCSSLTNRFPPFSSRNNQSCYIVQKFRNILPELSRRQWQILGVFALADFIAGIVYNIKGPFYPAEAEKKGVTSTQFGFVFGIFDITKVFVCPVFGKHMSFLGPRKVFISSMIFISICSILFGLLDKIDDPTLFLALSLGIRMTEAVASAGFSTSTFSIIAAEFDSVATAFSCLETCFGLGLCVGPIIGGIFFQIGGYDAPFISTGGLFFVVAFILFSVMPAGEESESANVGFENDEKTKPQEEGFSVFSLLKIPGVFIAAFGVFAAASSAGYINATLEPHIRQFALSPLGVGVVFIIYGGVYAFTAPGWGWACDRIPQPAVVTVAGGVLNFAAFLAIGPAPFFPMESALWLTCLGLVLHGLALGATFVSGFVLSLKYVIAAGFPNNMSTCGAVSGMWTSAMSLGMFFGPASGGILLDHVGFRWGSVYVLVSMIILVILNVLFSLRTGSRAEARIDCEVPEAIQPLLRASNSNLQDYGSGSA